MPNLRSRSNSVPVADSQLLGLARMPGLSSVLEGIEAVGSGTVTSPFLVVSSPAPRAGLEPTAGEVTAGGGRPERTSDEAPRGKGPAQRGKGVAPRAVASSSSRSRSRGVESPRDAGSAVESDQPGELSEGLREVYRMTYVTEGVFRTFADDVLARLARLSEVVQNRRAEVPHVIVADNRPAVGVGIPAPGRDDGFGEGDREKGGDPEPKVRARSKKSSKRTRSEESGGDSSDEMGSDDDEGTQSGEDFDEESFSAVAILVRLMRPLLEGSGFHHPGALEASLLPRCNLPSPLDVSASGMAVYRNELDLYEKFRDNLRDFDVRVSHLVSPLGTVRWTLARVVESCEPSMEELARKILIAFVTRWGVPQQLRRESSKPGANNFSGEELMEAALISNHHGARLMTAGEQRMLLSSLSKVKKVFVACGRATAQAGIGTGMVFGSADRSDSALVPQYQELLRGAGRPEAYVEEATRIFTQGSRQAKKRRMTRARRQFQRNLLREYNRPVATAAVVAGVIVPNANGNVDVNQVAGPNGQASRNQQ